MEEILDTIESNPTAPILKFKNRSPSPPLQMQRKPPVVIEGDPLAPLALQNGIRLPGDQYSCRPGGKRLYDLLHTDANSPDYAFDYEKAFGILAWQVREKEEEIYENDDIKDEYKVMHVLWMRWTMLNR